MICWVARQKRCLLPVTGSDAGFHSPPIQRWKRVNSLSGRDRKNCCLHENARQMSIQKSFNQIQGLASFAWTIHDNLAIRAMTDVSKHFKSCFQCYNQHNYYCSSILGIAIKNGHLLNLDLMSLIGYLAF